ncbi:MAG: ABC transporter ATP-binding protein [Pigmentiphaga sp.]|nr:ABC transporter ATP-binding protein [Pigmentiphaga sp.]
MPTPTPGKPSAAPQPHPNDAAGGQSLLQAHALSYAYGDQAPVFRDLSLHIRPGEIVALLGGSGCGKSTLLRTLSGLEPVQHGSLNFLGEPLRQPHPRAALIFQSASLLPWRDAQSNIAFGLNFKHQPRLDAATRRQRIAAALEAVGLQAHTHRYPAQLSGGQAQRVALARALVREPVLLFADEPFAALDAITRSQMQGLLIQLVHQWQAAVLLVTHDIDEAIVVADRILLMGRAAEGPAQIVREWQVGIERPRGNRALAAAELHFEILEALQSLHL